MSNKEAESDSDDKCRIGRVTAVVARFKQEHIVVWRDRYRERNGSQAFMIRMYTCWLTTSVFGVLRSD